MIPGLRRVVPLDRSMPLSFLTRRDDPAERERVILRGDLPAAVFTLALPVLGEQTLNLFVAFFDTWLAGNLPASAEADPVLATGAVGFAAYMSYLALMVALFVGAGTTALVSRFWGSGRKIAASIVMNRSLVMAAVAGLCFMTAILLFADPIIWLLKTKPSLADSTADYIRKESPAYPPLMISLIAASALRGSGDLRSPLVILVVVNTVNAALSWGLATGFGPLPMLGLDGIVVGTVTARYVQASLLLMKLADPEGLKLIARHWRIGGRITWRILRIGLPAAVDGLFFWIAHFVFLRIVNGVGSTAFAAHIVGIRVESLTYLMAGAWGTAASTMIGQNLGAGQPVRARHAGHEAAKQMTWVAIGTSLLFVLGTEQIFAFMTKDEAIQQTAIGPFRLVGFFQIFLGAAIVYVAALRGAGETRKPMLMTGAASYLVRLPGAYLLAITFGWGLLGAWAAMATDMTIRGLGAWAIYTFTDWEETKV